MDSLGKWGRNALHVIQGKNEGQCGTYLGKIRGIRNKQPLISLVVFWIQSIKQVTRFFLFQKWFNGLIIMWKQSRFRSDLFKLELATEGKNGIITQLDFCFLFSYRKRPLRVLFIQINSLVAETAHWTLSLAVSILDIKTLIKH